MKLPRIHDLIAQILDYEYVGICDGKAFFYQIEVDPAVRDFFGAELAAGRGRTVKVRLTRLPMGFRWAPAIAQRIALVLTQGLGSAWVDNFFVGGNSMEEYQNHRTQFLERLERTNCKVDDPTLAPQQLFEALGIQFNLCTKTYRLAPSWILKAKERMNRLEGLTAKSFYELAGTIVWFAHISRLPLCNWPHLMQQLGDVARGIAKGSVMWSTSVVPSADVVRELRELELRLEENSWVSPRSLPEGPVVEIFSDASDTHGAFLIFANDLCVLAQDFPMDNPFSQAITLV